MKRVVIGIDPGFDRVGWAVGQAEAGTLSILDFNCIQTKKTEPLVRRYHQIDQELHMVLEQYQPTEAAIESLFFAKNQTTAMHVAEARGVIISCLFRHQVPYSEYTPLQIKQAVTGYGRADKVAVEKMVRLQLRLPELPGKSAKILDDTLDALAIVVTHASRAY